LALREGSDSSALLPAFWSFWPVGSGRNGHRGIDAREWSGILVLGNIFVGNPPIIRPTFRPSACLRVGLFHFTLLRLRRGFKIQVCPRLGPGFFSTIFFFTPTVIFFFTTFQVILTKPTGTLPSPVRTPHNDARGLDWAFPNKRYFF